MTMGDELNAAGWALVYARRGWSVVPVHTIRGDGHCTCRAKADCSSPGKHPVTNRGIYDATTDEAKITRWFERVPKANVGIVTGQRSRLIVLDVDEKDGRSGDASLAQLIERHGPLPVTLEVLTGGQGRHFYFKHPGGRVPNKVGIAPGLDVRGDGGMVVAPPSLHASGGRYTWESGRGPGEVEPAPAPLWLVEKLQSTATATTSHIAGEPIPVGKRNATLASLAGTMRRRGMTEDEIRTALLAVNTARCHPPLPEREVESIARSIAAHDPGKTGHGAEYLHTTEGLVLRKAVKDGVVRVPLTNFTARIVADVREDDGVEVRRFFGIEARLRDEHTVSFRVPAERFVGMSWVLECLGAQAVVYPGQSDHARVAIQILSGAVAERQVYAHLGWRRVDGRWLYLHAGGAIDRNGLVSDLEVRLPAPLDRYVLPAPCDGEELQRAVRESLRMLRVAPDVVTFPVLAATYRAAIGSADFSEHVFGPTGQGKTELVALAQQHFGAGMDARHLPGNWSSTANALEGLAFVAKDALLVVDDFAPHGSQLDVQRAHREADRLLRAQGNVSGRLRMRADTSLRPPKPPRGLILSTGEDVPRGQSLQARVLMDEMPAGSMNWSALTACQKDASAGEYVGAMSGFVRWLADHYDKIQEAKRERVPALQQKVRQGNRHLRTAEIVANLLFGLQVFLSFAMKVGAIAKEEGAALFKRGFAALNQVAATQDVHQKASDPAGRFLDFLKAAIASGRAHLATEHGGSPKNEGALGWRIRGSGEYATLQPMGDRVGWLVKGDLYLEPEASFAAAQRMARDMNETIAVGAPTLRRRLRDRGVLVSVDDKRQELTVRRTLEGIRRKVLHLRAEALGISDIENPPSPLDQ